MAWLVAQDYKVEHLILGSMTLHHSFMKGSDREALIELAGQQFVNDIAQNLKPHQAKKQTIIYGDLENETGDILVLNTEHELTDSYIKVIKELI